MEIEYLSWMCIREGIELLKCIFSIRLREEKHLICVQPRDRIVIFPSWNSPSFFPLFSFDS